MLSRPGMREDFRLSYIAIPRSGVIVVAFNAVQDAVQEHGFVGGGGLHVADEEVGGGEVGVEQMEGCLEGGMEGERGYLMSGDVDWCR